MADETEQPEPETETEPPKKRSGLITLIKAIAFLTVVVLIEVAAASALLPSASETEAIAKQLVAADAAHNEMDESGKSSEKESPTKQDMHEVSLGAFHVLTYNPESGSSLNVDFDLYGIVLADDESDFFELHAYNERRIREQILITIRGTDVTDLTDAGLGLIKRKILEKTNRALGRPLLHEVVFSKFSFMER